MTAPNIVNISSITGRTVPCECLTTLTSVLENAAASGKVYRINSIMALNITSSNAKLDALIRRNSVDQYLIKKGVIEPEFIFTLTTRDEFIYLEEGDAIYVKADTATAIHLLICYETVM